MLSNNFAASSLRFGGKFASLQNQIRSFIDSDKNYRAGRLKNRTLVQLTKLNMASKVVHLPTGANGLPESGTVITKFKQFQVKNDDKFWSLC
jgi:hypothetical protein